MSNAEIEEGVLKDVLEQLEKERIKRAEVEAELFTLRQKMDDDGQSSTTTATTTTATNTSSSSSSSASSTSTLLSAASTSIPSSSSTAAAGAASSSSSSPSSMHCYTHCDWTFDDADRIHLMNNTLSELQSAMKNDSNKKRNKQSLSTSLTKLFNDLQDVIIEGSMGLNNGGGGSNSNVKLNVNINTNSNTNKNTNTSSSDSSSNTNKNMNNNNSSSSSSSSSSNNKQNVPFVNKKSNEARVKDEVNKTISEYNKTILNKKMKNIVVTMPVSVQVPFVWRYDEQIFYPILNARTAEFVHTLKQICAHRKPVELSDEMDRLRAEVTSLRVERDGYLEVIRALTPDNRALMLSSESQGCGYGHGYGHGHEALKQKQQKRRKDTLSMEAVQMLELMPWDDRARVYTSHCDRVDQWQVYNTKAKCWVDNLDLFPSDFISSCSSKADGGKGKTGNGGSSGSGSGSSSSGGSGNGSSNSGRFVDLSKDYPLPKRGTWEWIGGWSIDGVLPDRNGSNDDDEKGWMYAQNPQHIVSQIRSKCFENAYDDDIDESEYGKCPPTRKYRRRTWKRQRVLKSYPGISRRTSQLLSLFEQNSKLLLTVEKLQDQIFQMQNQLTQKEVDMDKNTITLLSQLSLLELENDKNTDLLKQRSKEYDILKSKVEQQSPTTKDAKKENSKTPIISWGSKDSKSPSLFKFNSTVSLAKYESKDRPADARVEGKKETKNSNLPNRSRANTMAGPADSKPDDTKIDVEHQNRRRADTEPKSPFKRDGVRKSPQAKSITPLISLRDVATASNPNVTVKKSSDDDIYTLKIIGSKSANEDDYVTIFQEEDGDEEKKVENNKTKSSNSSSLSTKVEELSGNRHMTDIKPRNVIDTFPWKLNRESIIQKVKSKVKDVENNVHNVKTNVQEIVEKAHSIQKMAHQVS